eukprot:5647136-Amphidinium_carterae.1
MACTYSRNHLNYLHQPSITCILASCPALGHALRPPLAEAQRSGKSPRTLSTLTLCAMKLVQARADS